MTLSNQVRLNVRLHRDENVAYEYERGLVESFIELHDWDPEQLRIGLKTQILKMSESCLRGEPKTAKRFLAEENLIFTERVAGLDWKIRLDNTESRRTMGRNIEAQVH